MRWLALVALVVAAVLLVPGLLLDDASDGASDVEGIPEGARHDARLLGTGGPVERNDRERGTLAGLVTLDGRPARARLTCEHLHPAGPLPDDPEDRWSWLLEPIELPGLGGPRLGTANDGSFAIDLEARAWRIHATCEDGTAGWTTAVVRTGETTRIHLDLRSGSHVLRGRVRWADGTRFCGFVQARLDVQDSATWPRAERTMLPRASCDEEGRFRLPPLPAGKVMLHAVSPKGASRVILVSRWSQVPWPHEIDWVVDAGYRTVTGRVVDAATGAGILLALVREPWGTERTRATTGGDGRFTLRTDADQIVVSAAGYAEKRVRLPAEDRELTIRLAATARFAGRVLRASDYSPVEGAVVHAIPHGVSDAYIPRATSGPDGAWTLQNAPSGPASLVVLGGGVCSVGLGEVRKDAGDPFRIDVPPSGSLRRDLLVEDSASLEGRALEAYGREAEGVTIVLTSRHGVPIPWRACRRRQAVEDGRYAFPDLIPGVVWQVQLRRDPRLRHDGPQYLLRAGEHLTEDLRLPSTRRAIVDVRDAVTGAPVREAYADLEDVMLRANAEGRIVISDLPPDREDEVQQAIGIEAPGYAPAWVDPWVSDEAQVVAMHRSAGIAGRIEGLPDGASYADVALRAAIHVWHVIPVAPDGTFGDPSFPDVPDRLFADLDHTGKKWSASAIADPGATDIVLTLVEQPDSPWYPVEWRIHVVGPDNRPVPEVVYDAGSRVRKSGSFRLGFTAQGGTIVHRQGRGAKGWIRIRASRDAQGRPLGYAARLVGPLGSEGGELEVTLRPGLSIEGRVVDGEERAVPGVRVEARFPGHVLEEFKDRTFVDTPVDVAYADARGRFRLEGLEPGVHVLSARGGGRHAPPEPEEIPAGRDDAVLVMRTAQTVDVFVEDPRGEPVPGASFSAGRSGGPWVHGQADGRGLIRIAGLDPEQTYRLRVNTPDDRPDLGGVDLPDWRPARTTVRLVSAVYLKGRLLDRDGLPVPEVGVHLFRSGKRTRYYHTDPDGTFYFWNLAAGETVGLAPEDSSGKPPSAPVREALADAKDVVLRSDRGPAIMVDLVGLPPLWERPAVDLLDARTGEYVADTRASIEGRVVFTGSNVVPGRVYAVLVPPLDTYPDRLGYLEGVRVREEPWRVEIRRGHVVRARITNPAVKSPRVLHVKVTLGSGIQGMVDPQGIVRIPGVPAGRWELVVSETYTGRERGRATVEVPGPEVVLTLNDP